MCSFQRASFRFEISKLIKPTIKQTNKCLQAVSSGLSTWICVVALIAITSIDLMAKLFATRRAHHLFFTVVCVRSIIGVAIYGEETVSSFQHQHIKMLQPIFIIRNCQFFVKSLAILKRFLTDQKLIPQNVENEFSNVLHK